MDHSHYITKAKELLSSVRGKQLTVERRREKAVELAALMLNEARRIQTTKERRIQMQLSRMMDDKVGKVFTTSMTDQCFRSNNSRRVADQLTFLMHKFGVPNFLAWHRRVGLRLFGWVGKLVPQLLVPATKFMLRNDTSQVILPGEPNKLSKHMRIRRKEGVRINLNHLGEAILGEEEAKRRLETYLDDLANPDVEYISVKISTICSQLNLLAWDETLEILSERLKRLYRAAQRNSYVKPDGTRVPKFVNLDMEEYRDLQLTVDLFRYTLEDPEFLNHSAGIVLQGYLPDAYLVQQELTIWAMKRVASGGAPIKIRIVKGANLAMEQVESALRGWPQAPYPSKAEVDANFKRMVIFGCVPDHAKAAHLGIASHNLFDIAYALLLVSENEVAPYVCFEMLEGMADHMRRVVQTLAGDMLLYCPAATKGEFQNAVAYLVRRLDENTAPENFLRHAFDLIPGTKEWQRQAALFSHACHAAQTVGFRPRRLQNRILESLKRRECEPFENEPDTDWSLPHNRKWAEAILNEWRQKKIDPIPLQVGGKFILTDNRRDGLDPSCPGSPLYEYSLADTQTAEEAVDKAVEAQKQWGKKSTRERSKILCEVANELRAHRADLIGAMVADTGKTIPEGDVEVSEAIDFADYYRINAEEIAMLQDIEWQPKGVVLVAPPWNFPCSIPAGGILAALAAGNSVIFKPAPEAVLVGWELVRVLWKGGIDRDLLQFIPCEDDPVGTSLIQNPKIGAVVLTGATATAKLFMKLRPGLDLLAETGGKNAMIVTRMADRDLAVKDVVQSAFGHAGQKCSACSLLICESEVYDDPQFRQQLKDAAQSLRVGSPWNPATKVNPLIREPNPTLLHGLTQLDEGEEWLLVPRQDPNNPNLWSPGIKLGVKPGSFSHQNEFFGPVLSVIRAKNLDDAIRIANATPYGLTSGIHSLDEREQKYWIDHIIAGNCYINRGITGAIVQRQPFGGCKESNFGPGAKAGGPNYLMQLARAVQTELPKQQETPKKEVESLESLLKDCSHEDLLVWKASIGSYAFFWNHYFSKDHDPSKLQGQDNFLRYLPQKNMVLRFQKGDRMPDLMRALAAAKTCGCELEVSSAVRMPEIKGVKILEESEETFIYRIEQGAVKRIRFLSNPSEAMEKALAEASCSTIRGAPLANGRVELLAYLREVSFSVDYHRYGNLGEREGEKRAPLPQPEGKTACEAQACCQSSCCG